MGGGVNGRQERETIDMTILCAINNAGHSQSPPTCHHTYQLTIGQCYNLSFVVLSYTYIIIFISYSITHIVLNTIRPVAKDYWEHKK